MLKARNLTTHVSYAEARGTSRQLRTATLPTVRETRLVLQRWHDAIPRIHDSEFGGFGNSKKFPQGLTLGSRIWGQNPFSAPGKE